MSCLDVRANPAVAGMGPRGDAKDRQPARGRGAMPGNVD